MDATLNIVLNTLAYGDVGITSNPIRRNVDWSKSLSLAASNVKCDPYTVAPLSTFVLFSGVRATSLDNTTEFALTLSNVPGTSNRYRFTWDGVGTAPVFRTDRAPSLSGKTVTWTANANLTASLASTAGDFAGVQAGDVLFVPDVTTGDAVYPGNPLNVGYWVVLSKDGTSSTLQLARFSGASWSGASEVVALTTALQIQVYSSDKVQVGDSVSISGGFVAAVQRLYVVVAVNTKWFEVTSTVPLPIAATAIPSAAGMQFFSSNKRFIQAEIDQECYLQLNGDTGNTNRLSPIVAGDPDNMATFLKIGPCWSASIVNTSSMPLNVAFISAE